MYKVSISNGGAKTVIHDGTIPDGARILGGTVRESLNAIPSFTFTALPDNPGYGKFEPMLTAVTVREYRSGEDIFIGRVLSVSNNMDADGSVYQTVTCEGELAFLCDTIQEPISHASGKISSLALSEILEAHNSQVAEDKKIMPGECELAGLPAAVDFDWQTTFDLVQGLMVEGYGGEIRLRNANGTRYLDFSSKFGETETTAIRLADNMLSVSRSREIGAAVTRLYPLGGVKTSGKRLTIMADPRATGNNYIENADLKAKYGVICGTVIFDDIVGEGQYEHDAAVRLYNKALKYFDTLNGMDFTYKISALDLSTIDEKYSTFKLYNSYPVANDLAKIGDTVRVTGRSVGIDEPHKSSLTFGTRRASLNSIISKK